MRTRRAGRPLPPEREKGRLVTGLLCGTAVRWSGIGTDLLSAALARLRAAGVSTARAGSGGTDCIWPGVPADLPAAGRLFTAFGWHAGHDTLDLVADLPGYRVPALAAGSAARAGVTIMPAAAADFAAVVAFEAATFPNWARWFLAGNRDILLARDSAGTIAATLLLDGPGADTVYGPMLGPAAATISCVGVAPRMEGRGIGTALVARASEICATAVPAPATSAGPSASRSVPVRDSGPGAATACSAQAPALTRFRLPLAQHDLQYPRARRVRRSGPGPVISADNCRYPLSTARISVDNDVSGGLEAGPELSG